MKKLRAHLSALLFSIALTSTTSASSMRPMSVEEWIQASDGVFRGAVVGIECFADAAGHIYTRTSLRVEEAFKGRLPAIVAVVHRGGEVAGKSEYCGLSPQFIPGADYVLFVKRGMDRALHCTQGMASALRVANPDRLQTSLGSESEQFANRVLERVRAMADGSGLKGPDLTDQDGIVAPSTLALPGMFGGVNSRFIQPDRGEPILCRVDATVLPSGITLAQATNAVRQALNAWAAVTSLRFEIEAYQSFGMGADHLDVEDGRLWIQLHDSYGSINSASTLGIGGRTSFTRPVAGGWDLGGNVAGAEFRKTGHGYVVLESGESALQNLSTFTEVLCHEIGHALNLAHSSEVPTIDPLLLEAMMYYLAHEDGRGATLGAYDPPVIRRIYPANTPPFGYSRFMDVTTAPNTPEVPGINEVRMISRDLQGTVPSLVTADPSSMNGSFSTDGDLIRFTPDGWYSDSPRISPSTNLSYDLIYARFSDGTNASPYSEVRVVSLVSDSGDPSDGIPDYWMTTYFGHAAPQAGDKSRAGDDADGDGLTNLQEYLAGMNPRDPSSAQRITSIGADDLRFEAKAYDVYQLEASANLTDWTKFGNPIVPVTTNDVILTSLPQTNITAVASNLPLTAPHLFFRVSRSP